jgi:molybdopterin-guanine dinucleotide biosynthesis protein A
MALIITHVRFAAVIVAGGAGRRLSGMDKPAIEVGGRSLLARAVAAVADAEQVVVVGPERPLDREVTWTREDPPGTGPLAALAAGLAALGPADEVAVLAADLPGVTEHTVRRLRAALGDRAGAVLTDADGHRQWLLGVWRRDALQAVLPENPANQSLRRTLGTLPIVEVPAEPGEAADVDTPDDLAAFDR